MSDELCCKTIHPEMVARLSGRTLSAAEVFSVSELFKLLGDPTRLRIVQTLSLEELCVCDLAAVLGMSDSAVSHQLRLLRQARLVKTRREGKSIIYSLDDHHVNELFETALLHHREKVGLS